MDRASRRRHLPKHEEASSSDFSWKFPGLTRSINFKAIIEETIDAATSFFTVPADELLPILNRQTTHALSDGSAIHLSGCLDFRLMLYGDSQMISRVALLTPQHKRCDVLRIIMSQFVLAVDVGGNVGGDRWLRVFNDEDSDLWRRPCHSHSTCCLRVSSFL